MSATPSQNPPESGAPLEEQLVAYLDRELDDAAARELEALLSSNPRLHEELVRLEQSWEVLEELERPEVDEGFTQTTLELVTVAAEEEVQARERDEPRRRRRRWLIAALGLTSALAAGFLMAAGVWPDPNRRLLEDLPILYSLEQYRQVDSMDFLRLLRAEGADLSRAESMPPRMAPAGFAPPRPEEPQSALPPAEITTHDLNVRRAWLEQFDATAKAELVRKREQFAALTADEQAKIRTLDGQLQRERQADELRKVMYDYYHWVRGLPLYERMALEDLAPAARVARVAELRQDEFYRQVREVLPDEQKFRRFQELVKGSPYSGKDMQELLPGDEPGFRAWLDAYIRPRAQKDYDDFLASRPDDDRQEIKKAVEGLDPERRQKMPYFMWWMRSWGEDRRQSMQLSSEDLGELRKRLSPQTGQWLAGLAAEDQRLVATVWIRLSVFRHLMSRSPSGPAGSREELGDFLDKNPNELDRVLRASDVEEMQRELWRRFMQHKLGDRIPGDWGRGRGFGWGGGEGRSLGGPGRPPRPGEPGEREPWPGGDGREPRRPDRGEDRRPPE